MGEGIIIGTVIVLSGLVLAIIKKSQGSSLPSEIDKKPTKPSWKTSLFTTTPPTKRTGSAKIGATLFLILVWIYNTMP